MKQASKRVKLEFALGTAICLFTLLLASRSMADQTGNSDGIPQTLDGTAWRLVHFQSMSDEIGTIRPDDPTAYTMQLNDDGTVNLRLNCNRAHGTWTAEPAGDSSGQFQFGPLVMTRAQCPEPSMDERIARDAEYVRSYLVSDGNLYLSLEADGGIYAWERVDTARDETSVPASPEDGGPRNWEVSVVSCNLNVRQEPSTSAPILTQYTNGTILDNLGVRTAEGRIWCDVQQLGGGPRGFVAYEYLKPAVSPDGSVATGPDNSALRAGQNDFDATGTIPCSQAAGQPMTECEFGVARAGGGYATVVVTHPDGTARAIYFRMGIPIGVSTNQADGYDEFNATREADLHMIRVGNERYEIPDAVVLGG